MTDKILKKQAKTSLQDISKITIATLRVLGSQSKQNTSNAKGIGLKPIHLEPCNPTHSKPTPPPTPPHPYILPFCHFSYSP